jgi:hypothetical protein
MFDIAFTITVRKIITDYWNTKINVKFLMTYYTVMFVVWLHSEAGGNFRHITLRRLKYCVVCSPHILDEIIFHLFSLSQNWLHNICRNMHTYDRRLFPRFSLLLLLLLLIYMYTYYQQLTTLFYQYFCSKNREPLMKKTAKCKTGKHEKSITNILTNQMWGKGSTSRQDNDVNIGELIILISVFN